MIAKCNFLSRWQSAGLPDYPERFIHFWKKLPIVLSPQTKLDECEGTNQSNTARQRKRESKRKNIFYIEWILELNWPTKGYREQMVFFAWNLILSFTYLCLYSDVSRAATAEHSGFLLLYPHDRNLPYVSFLQSKSIRPPLSVEWHPENTLPPSEDVKEGENPCC